MNVSTAIHLMRGSVGSVMVALDERDAFTYRHCDRVRQLASELGRACGLSPHERDTLTIAALFHDIGKIGIPDSVLLKPGRLDDDEWVIMKSHPARGERIFRSTDLDCAPEVAPIILHHHEAFDGSGYPDAMAGDNIPIACRILLIVDAYDAMTSVRPYRHALQHEKVMGILATEAGTRLDPAVVGAFRDVIARSPMRVH